MPPCWGESGCKRSFKRNAAQLIPGFGKLRLKAGQEEKARGTDARTHEVVKPLPEVAQGLAEEAGRKHFVLDRELRWVV